MISDLKKSLNSIKNDDLLVVVGNEVELVGGSSVFGYEDLEVVVREDLGLILIKPTGDQKSYNQNYDRQDT